MTRVFWVGCACLCAAVAVIGLRSDQRILSSEVGLMSGGGHGVVQVPFRRSANQALLSVWVNETRIARDVPIIPERYWGVSIAGALEIASGASMRVRVEATRSDGSTERVERVVIARPLTTAALPSIAAADDAVRVLPPDLGASAPDRCAPTVAANALIGLAKKISQDDRIPVAPQTSIDELATAMRWAPNRGVRFDDIVQGSARWVQEKGLAIQVRMTRGNSAVVLADIADVLTRGDTAMLQLQLRDERGIPHGSHAVLVRQVSPAVGGVWLTVHDPLSPLGSDAYFVSSDGVVEQYPYVAGRVSIANGVLYALRGTIMP